MKRKTKTDGIIREYYNGLFTELQEINKRLTIWDLPVNEHIVGEIKLIKQASNLEKLKLLIMYHSADQQRRYTKWFIVLTILLILSGISQILVGIYK